MNTGKTNNQPALDYRSDIQTITSALYAANTPVTLPYAGDMICLRAATGTVTLKVNGDNTNVVLGIGRTYKFNNPFGSNSVSLSSTSANDVITYDIGYGFVVAIDAISSGGGGSNVTVVNTSLNPVPVTFPEPISVRGEHQEGVAGTFPYADSYPLEGGMVVDMGGGTQAVYALRAEYGDFVHLLTGSVARGSSTLLIPPSGSASFQQTVQDNAFLSCPTLLLDVTKVGTGSFTGSITLTTAAQSFFNQMAARVIDTQGNVIAGGIITAAGFYYVQFAGMCTLTMTGDASIAPYTYISVTTVQNAANLKFF